MNSRSDEAGPALGDGILPQYLTLPRQAIQIVTRFPLRVVREKATQLSEIGQIAWCQAIAHRPQVIWTREMTCMFLAVRLV